MHIKDRQQPCGKDATCKNVLSMAPNNAPLLHSHPSILVCFMSHQFLHPLHAGLRLPGGTLHQLHRSARRVLVGTALAVLVSTATAQGSGVPSSAPAVERQQELVRMVRQDCGSCHGLRLTGGLGPALTPEALADKPLESMVSTIYRGRPGTPMAPWSAMLSEQDALWIAQQLFAGFPEQTPPFAKAQRP